VPSRYNTTTEEHMYNFQPNDIIIPDALDYPAGALRVDSWDGETLTAYPEGGGFGYTFNLDAIKKHGFYVVDIEMTTPRWRKAMFSLNDGPDFEGYHWGHRWNGWACPMFTLEVAHEIAEWMEMRIEIDAQNRVIITDENCTDEPDVNEGDKRARNGIPTMTLYGIGACGWCWDVTELED